MSIDAIGQYKRVQAQTFGVTNAFIVIPSLHECRSISFGIALNAIGM